ncbi:MAG: hypothetical protein ACKOC7_10120 [Sphingomonadales bacterium]
MKRIRTLQELEYEKMRLRLQRLEQERSLQKEWSDLKLTVAGRILLHKTLDRVTSEKSTTPDWFTSLLQVGAAALGEKLGQLTGQKIENTLRQVLRLGLNAWRKNRNS